MMRASTRGILAAVAVRLLAIDVKKLGARLVVRLWRSDMEENNMLYTSFWTGDYERQLIHYIHIGHTLKLTRWSRSFECASSVRREADAI